jgi:hypothetical protein
MAVSSSSLKGTPLRRSRGVIEVAHHGRASARDLLLRVAARLIFPLDRRPIIVHRIHFSDARCQPSVSVFGVRALGTYPSISLGAACALRVVLPPLGSVGVTKTRESNPSSLGLGTLP